MAANFFRSTACFFVPALLAFGYAPEIAAEDRPEILEVRRVYQDCRAVRLDERTKRTRLFGAYTDLSSDAGPVWHRQPPADTDVFDEMQVWRVGGRIRAANLLETTPSGDWSKLSKYCFRPDGSLAFIFSELRTFYGNVRVEDRLYFDLTGRQIRTLRKAFDMNSEKPVRNPNFQDQETTIFPTARALAIKLGPALGRE